MHIWTVGKLPSKYHGVVLPLTILHGVRKSRISFMNLKGAQQQIERNHPESYLSFPTASPLTGFWWWESTKCLGFSMVYLRSDSMWTVPLTPHHPFLSCFRLLLTFRKPVLLRTGTWREKNKWLMSSREKYQGHLWFWVSTASSLLGKKTKQLFQTQACNQKPTRNITSDSRFIPPTKHSIVTAFNENIWRPPF